MSRPPLIFVIAILALSQGTLWAQNDPYTTRPNIDAFDAPIEIRVAEDIDNYISDDEATQAFALARPSVATNPGNRTARIAESTTPAIDSAIANAALELTSENWFANYDVAMGNDTLTPSLETSLLPLEIPGYDFQWNDLPAIAMTQQGGASNEFEDVVLSPSYETRATVIKRAGTELLPIEEFELSRTLVDQPISSDRITETTIVNPLLLTSQEQPSPSDDRTFADQRLSTERISSQSAFAKSQTSQQYVRGFNPKTDRRRLVAAQAQRGVPRNRTQRTSGLGWLFMPCLAVPLAWFGVQHYRKQKALQLSLVGCGSCDLTHLQCDDCPEKSESTRQQREADSQTMHYQRNFSANGTDTCESGSVGVASNDFSEGRRRVSSAPSTGIAASATDDRTFGRQSERPTEERYETRESSCSIPAQRSQEFETASAEQGEQGERFESQKRASDRQTERETALENTSSNASRDDLTRIYGIGPATSEVLRREGIKSFSDIASTDSVKLESILEKAGNRFQLINPTTWPAQAEYAASGDWEGLETWRAAELESMESDSEFDGREERLEDLSRENFGEFEENDYDQEVAVLEDANSLLASVSGIRREFASFDVNDEIEEAGYDESSYDQYDSEERDVRTSSFMNQRDGESSQVEEDDLTEIRGIGAATQELLRDNGIRNFGDLLDADVDRLQDILDRAGSRFQTASPQAWLEHARDLTRVTQ